MKPADKAKAQTVVNEILSGDFNERTVEELFMRLRDSSSGIFRDFGHYMAHSQERDQGMAVKQLSTVYCALKIFNKYQTNKHPLNLQELPNYIIDYFHHQIDVRFRDNKKELIENYGGPKKLHKTINQLFALEDGKVRVLKHLSSQNKSMLGYLTGIIGSQPIYLQKEVIQSVILTIQQNGLNINEQRFKSHQSKFLLCLMCKLHETLHDVTDRAKGLCRIGYTADRQRYTAATVTMDAFKLALVMRTVVDCIDGNIKVQFNLLETDLSVLDHCRDGDITMFYDEDPQADFDVYMMPNNDSYFAVGDDAKLEIIKTA